MKNEVNVRYDDSRFPVLEENSPWNWWFLVPSWRTKRCFEIPPYFRTAEGFLFQNRRIRLILETDDMGLMKKCDPDAVLVDGSSFRRNRDFIRQISELNKPLFYGLGGFFSGLGKLWHMSRLPKEAEAVVVRQKMGLAKLEKMCGEFQQPVFAGFDPAWMNCLSGDIRLAGFVFCASETSPEELPPVKRAFPELPLLVRTNDTDPLIGDFLRYGADAIILKPQ